MAFPDRIERSLDLAHPPATVWAALTTPEGLSAWHVAETCFAQLPVDSRRKTYDSHAEGWASELGEHTDYAGLVTSEPGNATGSTPRPSR